MLLGQAFIIGCCGKDNLTDLGLLTIRPAVARSKAWMPYAQYIRVCVFTITMYVLGTQIVHQILRHQRCQKTGSCVATRSIRTDPNCHWK